MVSLLSLVRLWWAVRGHVGRINAMPSTPCGWEKYGYCDDAGCARCRGRYSQDWLRQGRLL